ncbi:MAG: CvpA family protein [Halanaerobiaceae bacterium]
MTLTVIDIIILIIFVYFCIGGFNKGFIKQTSTIMGILLAFIISMNFYISFVPVIEPYLDISPALMQFISFTVLFCLVNLIVHLVGTVFKKVLDALFLKPVDQVAGAVLGLVKGFILSYLLVVMLSHIPYVSLTQNLSNSFLAVKILDMTPYLQNSLQNIFGS